MPQAGSGWLRRLLNVHQSLGGQGRAGRSLELLAAHGPLRAAAVMRQHSAAAMAAIPVHCINAQSQFKTAAGGHVGTHRWPHFSCLQSCSLRCTLTIADVPSHLACCCCRPACTLALYTIVACCKFTGRRQSGDCSNEAAQGQASSTNFAGGSAGLGLQDRCYSYVVRMLVLGQYGRAVQQRCNSRFS